MLVSYPTNLLFEIEVIKNIDVEIHLTPDDLAQIFWEMPSNDQAQFYNKLGELADYRLAFQLQHITEEKGLSLTGRRVMQQIGEYSHWGLTCDLERETKASAPTRKKPT